jgi:hypothetical protein
MFVFLFFLEFNILLDNDYLLYSKPSYAAYFYNISTSEMKYGYVALGCEAVVLDYFFIGGSMKALVGFPYQGLFFNLLGLDSLFKVGFRYEGMEIGSSISIFPKRRIS